jgi:transcriptional regulator with PAS, ATPase and Fis domain
MSKILISWLAYDNDFIKGSGAVNSEGPTVTLHKHFYVYDKHILLTTSKNTDDDNRIVFLTNYLIREFQHEIVPKAMCIDDIINVAEILRKIETLIQSFKNDDIDIFISPGTPAMQVAWYFAHQSLQVKTNLFQLRNPQHTKSKQAEQVWVDIEKSSYTASLIIKQTEIEQNSTSADIYQSEILKPIYARANKLSMSDNVSVFISGESGTGKEKLARYIHDNSPRKESAFVAVNCAGLTDELANSQLFGYLKGAFTGADKKTDGFFHAAEGGTIFLDEIGDISPFMQKVLLRVLQEKEIIRVGAQKPEKCNVRVLTATRKNLQEMVNRDEFRIDLFYRIAVSEIELPSLKMYKPKDKELLFDFLWQKQKKIFQKKIPKLAPAMKKQILEYSFPGNIREMENTITSIIAETENEVLQEHLPKRLKQVNMESSLLMDDVEKQHIKRVLEMTGGNITRTAKLIGRSINTINSKLKAHGI